MNHRIARHHFALASASFAVLLTGGSAMAQGRPETAGDGLQLVLGGGAMSGPKYPGSSATESRALPLVSARYGRYFLGSAPGTGVPLGLGVNLIEASPWRLGVVLGPDLRKPRRESDAPQLKGLGDIDATAHAGVFASYAQPWWGVRGNVTTDAGGKNQGSKASLDLEGRYPVTESLTLSAGPGFTWADQRHMQTFFGVNAAQAANSGLPRYEAKAGVYAWKFSMAIDYRIDARWFISGRASVERLRGDARNSPITADDAPRTVGVFVGYRY